ncbi:unnamed protein product [Pleuronectes platessa]|uniref:Uncharacterized protein n=1 Tax=Pleuronectes platessa TaxID=8262 RepID=A0A9N7UYJ1_PLEPL|nr:unnamed protein product [Pleuronectes platessa]
MCPLKTFFSPPRRTATRAEHAAPQVDSNSRLTSRALSAMGAHMVLQHHIFTMRYSAAEERQGYRDVACGCVL